VIIHGVPEPLLATQVPLGRLDGNVAEELDLFQFTACLVPQAYSGSLRTVFGTRLRLLSSPSEAASNATAKSVILFPIF
jgi:hypothetical protein